jgi:hypothetical protein
MEYESHTNENHLWGSVLDLVPNGKQLCTTVQLRGQVASKDSTAAQFKDGPGGESIQTGPDGH